ncbi:MAG: FecR domain-containing protein, partial [Gemmatimonadaceae bacterium]
LFSVRAYPDDDDVRVVVVSGLVSLRAKRGTVDSPNASGGTRNVPGTTATVLYPGQMGLLDTRGKLRVAPVDTAAHMAWLSGRIAIDNAPLSAIAADLERRFDVSIAIPDSVLAAQRVTINTPTAVRTLGDVLDLITIPLGVRHRRTERGILLER